MKSGLLSNLSLQGAWVLLRNRLISRSFIVLFVVATNLYLFDVFLAAYARNTLPFEAQEKIYSMFGGGKLGEIYVASVLDALVVSSFVGYVVSRMRARVNL